jgi:hypothetical protein
LIVFTSTDIQNSSANRRPIQSFESGPSGKLPA